MTGFGERLPEGADTFVETSAGHGRIEVRRYTQLPVTEQLAKAAGWTDARSVIRVERERHIGDKRTCESVYYISSHAPNAALIADAIRSHWEVENSAGVWMEIPAEWEHLADPSHCPCEPQQLIIERRLAEEVVSEAAPQQVRQRPLRPHSKRKRPRRFERFRAGWNAR